MLKRAAREDIVHKLVERFFILPGNHRLVTTGVIHVDDISGWLGGIKHDFVVRGPVGATTESPCNDYSHKKGQSNQRDCHSGTQQHDRYAQKSKPDKRWQRKESDNGETGNPYQAANDVKSVSSKRFYLRKQLAQRATERDEAGSDHAEYERQNEEVFCTPALIGAWYVIDDIGRSDAQFESIQSDDDDHQQYQQRERRIPETLATS